MKRKLVAALLVVLVMASMATAYARVDWSYWVDYPDGSTELVDPADFANGGWGNGELGDESVPLYGLYNKSRGVGKKDRQSKSDQVK